MKYPGIKLRGGSAFHRDLRKRIDAHFDGRSRAGGAAMIRKTATLFLMWAVIYAAFLAFGGNLLVAVLLGIPFGLVLAGFGFSVQHDGNHGAYSDDKQINRFSGLVLDLIGGSSFLWRHKHNHIHHSHPNIVGADDDLEAGWFLRMAPTHDFLPMHRWQHVYMWPLYGFISVKWQLFDDFAQLKRGHINDVPFAYPKGRDLVDLIVCKSIFVLWFFVIPTIVLGFGPTVVFYLVSQFVLGVTLATVFQLAHCVEEARFIIPPGADDDELELDYATLQLETTVDFAPTSRFWTWYLGGLNFQTVHHLFPRVSHIHYPAMARIVEEAAADHGLTYRCHPTVGSALASHFRWMKRMGAGETAASAQVDGEPLHAAA